ncbi:tetratricopeptide repeat protein [Phenylobacterium sp.]|uniref:tetratricopeptide repeat protein n=1 Tax=Phenylobacterium sp. TaxID=1871053 RepID=UPI004036CC34
MRLRSLTVTVPVLLLAACASPPASPGGLEARSPYGLFLAGQAALNDGESRQAAEYFERATRSDETPGLISERAFTAAVLSGEIEKAAAMAPVGDEASEGAKRLGRLVLAVDALAAGRGDAAYGLLTSEEIGFPHRTAAALLTPWAAAQAGDMDLATRRPDVPGDKLVEYFGMLGQAHQYERVRRYDEAETDFKALTEGPDAPPMLVIAYGEFLERRGRRADAVALYDRALSTYRRDVALSLARERALARRAAPPPPTVRQGAAQAILTPAAAMLAARQSQFALAYVRLALRLDPERMDAWMMVGDLMGAAGDVEAARAAYGRVPKDHPDYAAAQSKLAWSLQGAGEIEAALDTAARAAEGGDPTALLTLADLLRTNERYEAAIAPLNQLMDSSPEPDWRLLFARGAAYERMGDWDRAEADLTAALALNPDEPDILNYLAYGWIDRGERLEEALAMVQSAVDANPRSGAMIDSLGWGYYRLGQYEKAVEILEEAVGLEAGDPEINNHLGDAYWQVGRRDEAVFQWRRVLTLEPDARIRADAEAKLASGTGPGAAAATAQAATEPASDPVVR